MLKISSFEVVGIQIISVSTVNFIIIDCMKMNFIIGLKLHADDRKIIAICHLSIPESVSTLQTKHNFFATKHVILHRHLCDSSKIIWFGYTEVIYMYLYAKLSKVYQIELSVGKFKIILKQSKYISPCFNIYFQVLL